MNPQDVEDYDDFPHARPFPYPGQAPPPEPSWLLTVAAWALTALFLAGAAVLTVANLNIAGWLK